MWVVGGERDDLLPPTDVGEAVRYPYHRACPGLTNLYPFEGRGKVVLMELNNSRRFAEHVIANGGLVILRWDVRWLFCVGLVTQRLDAGRVRLVCARGIEGRAFVNAKMPAGSAICDFRGYLSTVEMCCC